MSTARLILAAFRPDEHTTTQQICERTGVHIRIVSSWVAQFREKGYIVRIPRDKWRGTSKGRPQEFHMLIATTTSPHGNTASHTDVIVREAVANNAVSVWHFAERAAK